MFICDIHYWTSLCIPLYSTSCNSVFVILERLNLVWSFTVLHSCYLVTVCFKWFVSLELKLCYVVNLKKIHSFSRNILYFFSQCMKQSDLLNLSHIRSIQRPKLYEKVPNSADIHKSQKLTNTIRIQLWACRIVWSILLKQYLQLSNNSPDDHTFKLSLYCTVLLFIGGWERWEMLLGAMILCKISATNLKIMHKI